MQTSDVLTLSASVEPLNNPLAVPRWLDAIADGPLGAPLRELLATGDLADSRPLEVRQAALAALEAVACCLALAGLVQAGHRVPVWLAAELAARAGSAVDGMTPQVVSVGAVSVRTTEVQGSIDAYDAEAGRLLRRLGADSLIFMVVNGRQGSGFSFVNPGRINLAAALRALADAVEADERAAAEADRADRS